MRAGESEGYCCSGCRVARALSSAALDGSADRTLPRLLLSAFLAMGVMVFSMSLYSEDVWSSPLGAARDSAQDAVKGLLRMAALLLSLPVMGLVGLPLLHSVVGGRRWLSADALILLGVSAAWALSVWSTLSGSGQVYFDTATTVLVLLTIGRWLEARARRRAHEALLELLPEREAPVLRLTADGFVEEQVAIDALARGDRVRVRPGGQLPVDGRVLEGRAFVDERALTGEEEPRAVQAGSAVLAGAIVLDGSLLVRADEVGEARLAARMAGLIEQAMRGRSHAIRMADAISRVMIPLVVLLALGVFAWRARSAGGERGLMDALAVLLIACPCGLGLATPLVYWFALSKAWRRGALVRGAEALERLAGVDRLLFDKTGTLTTGEFELVGVEVEREVGRAEALALAAALERHSEHPIARALRRAAQREQLALPAVEDFRALPGRGVAGRIHGKRCELLRAIDAGEPRDEASRVELWRGERRLACFRLVGELRPEAAGVLAALRQRGLALRVLTGDGRGPAAALEQRLALPVEAELLPDQKLARVRAEAAQGRVGYVGDGLNDGAALAAADVGISMSRGVRASLEAAHVNLLRPGLELLPELIDLARSARRAAWLNLTWAFGYNAVGLYLAAIGKLNPVFAASSMVASSLFVVWNASRVARVSPAEARAAAAPLAEPRADARGTAGVPHAA